MKFSTIAIAIIGFAAPATAFTSFADAMSGGPKPAKPASYGPGGGRAKPQSAPSPVVAANSADVFTPAASAGPASGFPGGGAAPVKAGGYGFSKGPYKVPAKSVGSYLDNVTGGGGAAPAAAASQPAAAGAPGGGAAPVKAGGYGPSKGPYKVAKPALGSYLDAVSGSAPPLQNGAAAPAAPAQPAASAAPPAAPVKAGGWGPSKGAYKVPAKSVGSYLDGV